MFSDKELVSCYRSSGSMPVPKQFIPKPKPKKPLPPVFIAVPITAYVTSEESRFMPGRRRPMSVEPNILTHPITEANLEPCCIKPKIVRPMTFYPHRSWPEYPICICKSHSLEAASFILNQRISSVGYIYIIYSIDNHYGQARVNLWSNWSKSG